ncbi:protein phosphatase 1G isoform X2 [Brienomyrus brachyistius]|uniref:protein phosphatase 1G isoform X2 n=1 Tax=Brienomyrus brachyistius TaxID=42636 RepID=UPI0020B28613|nr:protein phosphatase 1G isoform X2 [Brienomyrus brachyistius]
MGAYLSQPNTVKSTADGGNKSMSYGFAAMQGWRVSMEDAHNCIPELDEETAMFAVYDGHGGEEVALYCSKYLPDIIKDQKAYKDGKLQKALEDAFLAIDNKITTEEVIKELSQIAGRPQEDMTKDRVAEEDDVDNEEAALLHEEATMTIEELLVRYGQNLNSVRYGKKACPGSKKEAGDGERPFPEKGVNGEAESETAGVVAVDGGSSGKERPESADGSSGSTKMRACRRGATGEAPGEKASRVEGEPGPSCSSSSTQVQSGTKSKFFEDSDESEEAEDESEDGGSEEEEEEEEDCSEDDEGEYSSEGDEEGDTEELDEEEMCLPGMDGKEEPGSDSGTTAVVALIRGKQLIVANAGDSRCVLSEKGKAVDMSYDHKPEDELELARIKNAGGKVTMDGRVNGGLNLSRAIGDHFYKRNKTLSPEDQMISAKPDVKVLALNEEHDFMVIACDGIWNVMSSQEVVDFVSERIKPNENGKVRALSSIVEELLDQCLAPDTSGDGTGCDNMTCIVVTLRQHEASGSVEQIRKRKSEDDSLEKNGAENKKAKQE